MLRFLIEISLPGHQHFDPVPTFLPSMCDGEMNYIHGKCQCLLEICFLAQGKLKKTTMLVVRMRQGLDSQTLLNIVTRNN